MHQRCKNPNRDNFKRYGGAGVRVCDRWSGPTGFANFLADMGDRPAGKTLDRFPDKWGDYEPGNTRWATRSEQAKNARPRGFLRRGVAEDLGTCGAAAPDVI